MFGKRISGAPLQRMGVVLTGLAMVPAASAYTVISEVLYDANGIDNGQVFVELFGTPGTDLEGLLLEGVNGSDGGVYRSASLFGLIPPDGVFVIADDSGDGTTGIAAADFIAEVDFQNGPDSIVLRDGGEVIDALGYGEFSAAVFAGEGDAAPNALNGSALARLTPGVDTGNNRNDFSVLGIATPGSVPVNAVPVPPAVVLFLSGIAGLVAAARNKNKLKGSEGNGVCLRREM